MVCYNDLIFIVVLYLTPHYVLLANRVFLPPYLLIEVFGMLQV